MDEFEEVFTETDAQAEGGAEDDWGDEGTAQANRDAEDDWSDVEAELSDREDGEEAKNGQPEEKPETFTLKHLEREIEADRDQMVSWAQKGLDYDRIRIDRDALRQYRQQADPAYEYVRGMAREAGLTINDYLARARAEKLMSGGLPEEAALSQAEHEESVKRVRGEQRELREYDSEIRLEDMPEQFWERVKKGQNMLKVYLQQENARLRAQLEAERQKEKNRKTATSSRKSAGESADGDPFLIEFLRN